MIQTTISHPIRGPFRNPVIYAPPPSEVPRRIGDGRMVGIGEVGVSLPDTSVTPTTGELRAEDEERVRLTYGLGDSTCGDSGARTGSTSSGCV